MHRTAVKTWVTAHDGHGFEFLAWENLCLNYAYSLDMGRQVLHE